MEHTPDYEHIQFWEHPDNYAGQCWPATYSSGVGQSRDSDALERANFKAMLDLIGGESETVTVVRESHWAVGWVEWIAIHQDDETACKAADKAMAGLQDYPIIDESLYSDIENEDCEETWGNCFDRHERAKYLRDHGTGPSVFVDIREALKGSWYHAANILNCPSDILA